jgi:ABC-2 type transport system ATP-binding protein
MNVIECARVGKRYGRAWALRDCTLAIPDGHVVALVGPNGAGKTTLLQILVGLNAPTEGAVAVLDGELAGSPAALDGVAFVAQDAPLYQNLTAGDMLRVASYLNWRWDQERAEARLDELGIPLTKKVGSLSGGQQAQLALTVALARRPALLVLDEPLARLDPLARHDFMASVMAAVAADGMSVIMSSHVLAELEPVADYLVMLSAGRVQVAGEVDELLASHRLLTGPAAETGKLPDQMCVLQCRQADAQAHLLVRSTKPAESVPPGWEPRTVTLQELVLAYLRQPDAAALSGPARVSTDLTAEVQA